MKVEIEKIALDGVGHFLVAAIEKALNRFAKVKTNWHKENRDKLIKLSDLKLVDCRYASGTYAQTVGNMLYNMKAIYLLYTYDPYCKVHSGDYIYILFDKDFNIITKLYEPVD